MNVESFLKVVKEYEETKKKFKELSNTLTKELEDLGIGVHFQDAATGIVYEIVEPKGTFVSYNKISYNRTKTDDEVKGSLSKKRAGELGYK